MSVKTAEDLKWTERDVRMRASEVAEKAKGALEEVLERELASDPFEVKLEVERILKESFE